MHEAQQFLHKKNTLKFSLADSPNLANHLKLLDDWSSKIPTIYFLDSNCITHIRKWRRERPPEGNNKERKLFENLKKINQKQHGVSFFPSLMERVSNQHSTDLSENVVEQMYKDFNTLDDFYTKAKIAEDTRHLSNFIYSYNGKHIEADGEALHLFLNRVNKLGLYNTPPQQQRFKTVKTVYQVANELGLVKSHPAILGVIGCIYDCKPAKGVLKFKPNESDFSSSNALGDIMMLSRISKLAFPVIKPNENGKSPFHREAFITSDNNLGLFYDCFKVTELKVNKRANGAEYSTNMNVDLIKLLPALYDKNEELNEQNQKELDKLYQLWE